MSALLVRPAFLLDTEADLGPQLVAARAEVQPVPWKLLAAATGVCERHLRRLHDETRAAWKCPLVRTDKRRPALR